MGTAVTYRRRDLGLERDGSRRLALELPLVALEVERLQLCAPSMQAEMIDSTSWLTALLDAVAGQKAEGRARPSQAERARLFKELHLARVAASRIRSCSPTPSHSVTVEP